MRKLSSNTRGRTQFGEKELRTALIPRVLKLCSEEQLGRAPENVDNPMIAP